MKLIANYNNQQCTFEYSLNDKWIDIKLKLIKLLNLNVEYIDLEFMNDRPIREFGKHALVLGLIERIYDDYYINDFIAKNRDLIVNVHLVKNKIKEVNLNCSFTDIDFPILSSK